MITSNKNAQVKNLISLVKKSKIRNEKDVFVIEGKKMFEECDIKWIEKAYLSETFYNNYDKQKLENISYEVLSDEVFEHAADTKTPQGVIAVLKQFHYDIEDIVKNNNSLILIIENLQDPGNLGTIIRAGEGAGITGVIISSESVDIYNPKTIRSTMGSIYRVPFIYTDSLQNTIEYLKKKDVKIYAADLKGTDNYDAVDYKNSSAFIVGNEANGITQHTSSLADTLIKIPMCGSVESLNAAIAASILMYEASRQRR